MEECKKTDLASLSHKCCEHSHSRIEEKRTDSTYLIIVVMTMKERLLSEDHAGKHATQTPHVQAVVIHLQITKRTERLEVVSLLCDAGKKYQFSLLYNMFCIALDHCVYWHEQRSTEASPGNLPAVQVPWSTWTRLSRCTLGLGGRILPNPNRLDGAERWKEMACVSWCERQEMMEKCLHVLRYLSVFMINHYVVWLDISVHYPHTVAIIQGLK